MCFCGFGVIKLIKTKKGLTFIFSPLSAKIFILENQTNIGLFKDSLLRKRKTKELFTMVLFHICFIELKKSEKERTNFFENIFLQKPNLF